MRSRSRLADAVSSLEGRRGMVASEEPPERRDRVRIGRTVALHRSSNRFDAVVGENRIIGLLVTGHHDRCRRRETDVGVEFVDSSEFVVEFFGCRFVSQQMGVSVSREFVVRLPVPNFSNQIGGVEERIRVSVSARILSPPGLRVGSGMGPRARIVEQVPDNVKCDW